MATRSEFHDSDRIKEVLRLLKLAIENCHRLLAEAESDVHKSRQDNEPPQHS